MVKSRNKRKKNNKNIDKEKDNNNSSSNSVVLLNNNTNARSTNQSDDNTTTIIKSQQIISKCISININGKKCCAPCSSCGNIFYGCENQTCTKCYNPCDGCKRLFCNTNALTTCVQCYAKHCATCENISMRDTEQNSDQEESGQEEKDENIERHDENEKSLINYKTKKEIINMRHCTWCGICGKCKDVVLCKICGQQGSCTSCSQNVKCVYCHTSVCSTCLSRCHTCGDVYCDSCEMGFWYVKK